jgi:hypothetical protein
MESPAGSTWLRRNGIFLLLIAVITVAGLILVARVQPTIRNGLAHSAEGAISIETTDWTYGVPLDGITWVDSANSWHEGGRPDCLPPATDTISVRFASVEVTVEKQTWRPVVWVDCRATP